MHAGCATFFEGAFHKAGWLPCHTTGVQCDVFCDLIVDGQVWGAGEGGTASFAGMSKCSPSQHTFLLVSTPLPALECSTFSHFQHRSLDGVLHPLQMMRED